MAQDEAPIVVGPHLEIAVPGIEPAVEDFDDREAPLSQCERSGLFFPAVPCVAFNAYLHGLCTASRAA